MFPAYIGPQGRALVDKRRYLPEGWTSDDARRQSARVPEERRAAQFLPETVSRVRYAETHRTTHRACRQRLLHSRHVVRPPRSEVRLSITVRQRQSVRNRNLQLQSFIARRCLSPSSNGRTIIHIAKFY